MRRKTRGAWCGCCAAEKRESEFDSLESGELPYRESSPERIAEFRQILVERGVPAFVRYSRGRDVMAACGQLALLQIDGAPLSVVSPR